MEGLIDKLKENATEIFLISSKSYKRTKEKFLLQNYHTNLFLDDLGAILDPQLSQFCGVDHIKWWQR